MGRRREEPITVEARLETKRRLDRTPNVTEPATARLIYDAMVKVADRMTETNKQLESKANGVIALSSALLGFGTNFANAQHAAHWGFAVGAILSLLLAIGSALRVNFITTFDLPSPGHYSAAPIAAAPGNEAKIALELAESWHQYTADERTASYQKVAWLNRSAAFMGIGILAFAALAIDVLLAGQRPAAPPVVY